MCVRVLTIVLTVVLCLGKSPNHRKMGRHPSVLGFFESVARSERFTSQFLNPFELNHLTISIILIAHEIYSFYVCVCVCIHNKSFNNPFVFYNKCVEDVRESVREIHLK